MYIVGKKYSILCWIYEEKEESIDIEEILWLDHPERDRWIELNMSKYPTIREVVIPLYDHPHSDIENGQKEIHYHINSRFCDDNTRTDIVRIKLPLSKGKLEYRMLPCVGNGNEYRKTHFNFIKKSQLKHKCIKNGKCPHRGYDLSKETPTLNTAGGEESKEWVITCPLHSLKFNAGTGELLNDPTTSPPSSSASS